MPVIVFWVIIDSLIYSSTLDIFTSQEYEWLKKVRHVLLSICKLNPWFLIAPGVGAGLWQTEGPSTREGKAANRMCKVSGYKFQSRQQSIAGCPLLLRTLNPECTFDKLPLLIYYFTWFCLIRNRLLKQLYLGIFFRKKRFIYTFLHK